MINQVIDERNYMKKKLFSLFAAVIFLSGCTNSEDPQSADNSGSAGSTGSDISTGSSVSAPAESSSTSSEPVSEPAPEPEPVCEYEAFFKEEKVHEMNIEISSADWNAMLSSPYSKTDRRVNITIDGETLNNCAIHPRGVTQLQVGVELGNGRLPFKIKFDEFVDKQRFKGLDELVLDNSACDASYLRQYVALDAFREMGVDAPFVTFFNVSVNGKPHGFYVGIEAIDSRFLERAFESHKHNLYKADYYASLAPGMKMSALEQKKGSDETKEDIKKLIQIIDETPLGEKGEIDDYIDVDGVLRILAVDAVIHNWDGYAGEVAHNYYLYMGEEKFHMIPWDLNEAFLQTEAGERPGLGSKEDIITPITGYTTEKDRPLVQKLMAVDEYYKKYITCCAETNKWLEEYNKTRIPELNALIKPFVETDATRIYSLGSFNKQFDTADRDGLAGFITERCEFLNTRIPEILSEKGITIDEITQS